MNIPKLEDLPLVEVRNNYHEEWFKARLLYETKSGHFLCESPEKGILHWDQMREIKEPEFRKANRDEWLAWACSADALGYVVKVEDEDYYPPQLHSYLQYDCETYKRAKMTQKGPGDFEYYMVPVEVEE